MSETTRPIRFGANVAGFSAGIVASLIAMLIFQAIRVDAVTDAEEMVFVPLDTPCRLIDTRPGDQRVGPYSQFGPEDTKTIDIAGECGVADNARAVSLNITAIGATTKTNLRVWPEGDVPRVSSLNPAPGQPATPNAVTTGITTAGSFQVYNANGSVDAIIDVNGYYVRSRTPIVWSVHGDQLLTVDSTATLVRSLTIVGTPAGTLVVNSSHHAAESQAGDGVVCSLGGVGVISDDTQQSWQSGGAGSGGTGQMSGTVAYDLPAISGSAPFFLQLVCSHNGSSGSSNVYDASLNAVLYPSE